MKAIVWKEIGKVETVLDWKDPVIRPDELLVRVKAAGICRTDLHMIEGTLNFAEPPWILGHEISGEVEQVGELVNGWKPGDRVVVDPVISCGTCKLCLTGRKYLCAEGGELGATYGQGGYGEFVVVKSSNLYALPKTVSFEEGAMMEPLNCTMGAIHRVPNMISAKVAVFGDGPAGLLFTQLAKVYGAADVTLVGMNNSKLELGLVLGADRTVNVNETNLDAEWLDQSFDITIDAVGSLNTIADCFRYAAASGTVVLYGLNGSSNASIVSDLIVQKALTIVTCTSAPLLWVQGIQFVASGRIRLKEIISDPIRFEDAERMVNLILEKSHNPLKAVICY